MTPQGREESAVAELDAAREELAGASALLAAGLPRLAIGRTYFAVFHAARARLFDAGLEPKTHAVIDEPFVREELAAAYEFVDRMQTDIAAKERESSPP